MKRRLSFLIVATFAIFVVGYGVRSNAQQPTAPASKSAAPRSAAEPSSPAAAHQAVVMVLVPDRTHISVRFRHTNIVRPRY